MSRISFVAVALAASVFAMPAAAQDVSADPNYGSVELEAGFEQDPYIVQMTAGGTVNAEGLGGDCVGMISEEPDFRLFYEAGDYNLFISAAGDADLTLVINTPDGSWACDDDNGQTGTNPAFGFEVPQSGQYDIWVGTYNEGYEEAALYISEIGTM